MLLDGLLNGVLNVSIYFNPKNGLPVKIVIDQSKNGQQWTYDSIEIDGHLDDKMFSLTPPDGYRLFRDGLFMPFPAYVGKMYAKMRHLIMACHEYAGKHDGDFPRELVDLHKVGVSDEKLKTLLSSPDDQDGPAVIQYRRPRKDSDWSKEVMLYEAYDEWPDRGIVVGFTDTHCEVIDKQENFEELMK